MLVLTLGKLNLRKKILTIFNASSRFLRARGNLNKVSKRSGELHQRSKFRFHSSVSIIGFVHFCSALKRQRASCKAKAVGMSFSTRVILDDCPPASHMVRQLTLAMWFLPILISLLCMSAARTTIMAEASALQPALSSAWVLRVENRVPRFESPVDFPLAFNRAALTPYNRGLLHLPRGGTPKFSFNLQANSPRFDADMRPARKSALKVVQAPDRIAPFVLVPQRFLPRPAFEKAVRPPQLMAGNLTGDSAADQPVVQTSTTRILRRASVAGANVIRADGVTIILAGIAPPVAEARCKRIDGVVQSCVERAEHRLAILLQARRIVCRIAGSAERGTLQGHCKADDIDIAADLMRQGLARKMTIAQATRAL